MAIYYADAQQSLLRLPTFHEGDAYTQDNGLFSLTVQAQGHPIYLTDLSTDYDALGGACEFAMWADDRDPWYGAGHHFAPENRDLITDSVDCVEVSDLRKVLRVRQHAEAHAWKLTTLSIPESAPCAWTAAWYETCLAPIVLPHSCRQRVPCVRIPLKS